MEKKLVKLEGYSSAAKSGIGEYRDNKGRGLTGFYRNENENSFEVMELNRGHRVVSYKFPKIEIPFKSKMHSWRNLAFSCDWYYKDEQVRIDKLKEAVEDRQKPFGYVALTDDAMFWFEGMALEYAMTQQIRYGVSFGFVGNHTFGQHFDLEAFIRSYELLEEAHYGERKGFIMNEFVQSKIRALSEQKILDCLQGYLSGKTNSDYDLILLGLLFGHPIESTFASLVGSMVYNNKS
ncbi:hypothetical protein J27TS7_16160 [Paenibacillus dendritiformis]|uniref:hypothetical protein n=1 Tax=Paenibacillus dendritiformis TaxID=130049 RepID=UPI001B2AE2CC|nr:hypothetical protein [Paenibacillus dendritiformis]GIO72102.1 hypothetical protein J27TS7_16160 [Paenibacillus dendritiformis]